MKTTAKKDGDDFIIDGGKVWISTADLAGIYLVMANADPSAVSPLKSGLFAQKIKIITGLPRNNDFHRRSGHSWPEYRPKGK